MREKKKKKCDLDILIDFESVPTFFTFIRLERYLSQELNIKVDLVMRRALKPAIGKNILNEVVHV